MTVKVNPLSKIKNSALWLLAAGLMAGTVRGPAATPEPDVRRDATVDVVERVMPSVVNIAIATLKERDDAYYRWLRQYHHWPKVHRPIFSAGSGVIIHEDGYLITNFHVVEGATRIQVKLANGEIYDAERRIANPQRDIVLLQIILPDHKKNQKFQAMKFARDDDLLLGETVIAIGNPYGLGGSVTRGILSSKNRRDSSGNQPLEVPDWLQTDAGINPGNSGGPLINLRGELIGLNVAVHREDQGMGVSFAVPVKQINAALTEFFTPEAANHLWLGARISSFETPLSVSYVLPRSPAETAGLRAGQRIVNVNGRAPRNLVEFQRLVTARLDTDQRATIEVEDDGARRAVNVQLIPFDDLTRQKLGVLLGNLSEAMAEQLGVKRGDAVIIQAVEPGSPADKINLRPGFLVTALDDRPTGIVISSAEILGAKAPGDRMKISFYVPSRQGGRYKNFQSTVTVR